MVKGINYQLFGEDSTKTISLNNFMAGFVTATTGKKGLMTVEEASETAQRLMQQIKAREMEKTYGPNKEAGEKFLAENAKKEGVKTLPSGVQYKVLKEGNGATAADTSMVVVNYEGRLLDGTVFDSNKNHGGDPATFRVGQVIKGWQDALKAMPAGSEWEIYIPQELAYGANQQGNIPPFSTLIFKVELLEVK
jgi:FKBP-type peptidyl-prolyl cis-trans isomerase FklB